MCLIYKYFDARGIKSQTTKKCICKLSDFVFQPSFVENVYYLLNHFLFLLELGYQLILEVNLLLLKLPEPTEISRLFYFKLCRKNSLKFKYSVSSPNMVGTFFLLQFNQQLRSPSFLLLFSQYIHIFHQLILWFGYKRITLIRIF